jgi:hypothetical protein
MAQAELYLTLWSAELMHARPSSGEEKRTSESEERNEKIDGSSELQEGERAVRGCYGVQWEYYAGAIRGCTRCRLTRRQYEAAALESRKSDGRRKKFAA